jgi:DNA repair exonuclease SbcCD ATPase subunit
VRFIYVMLLAILIVVPACNRNDTDRVRAAEPDKATTDQMKQERDDYVKSVEAKLAEFDQKFDGLDARAKAMSGAAKIDFNNDIDRLREQRKAVSKKLDDLKGVSISSWMTLKGEVDAAMTDLERSYEQVSAEHEKLPAAAPSTPRH